MLVKKYPNRNITNNNKKYLYFGGTDYLGIQQNKDFIDTIKRNLERWGSAFGSSPNANIKLEVYSKFEAYIASFLNTKNAVSVSSGTVAGILIKNYFSNIEITRFHIEKSHPSIVLKKSQLVYKNSKINPVLLSDKKEDILICTDAIIAQQVKENFSFLDQIHPNKKVHLLIDESHSLGVLGSNGNGVSININHAIVKRKIIISSLSKAFGISAGIISSDAHFIKKIKQDQLYSGASGANPAFIQSFMDSKTIYTEALIQLKNNMNYVYKRISNTKLKYHTNYPVIYYPAILNEKLEANNIITTQFTYHNTIINRIILKANHTKADLDKLIAVINKI